MNVWGAVPLVIIAGDTVAEYLEIVPVFDVAVLLVTGPSAAPLPLKQKPCPFEPVIVYVHWNVAELPGASDDTLEGAGPDESVSVAPPAQGVSAEGRTFTSAVVPLFVTVISTVALWPLTRLAGLMVSAAVKLPITTVLELTFTDFAFAVPFVARAVK